MESILSPKQAGAEAGRFASGLAHVATLRSGILRPATSRAAKPVRTRHQSVRIDDGTSDAVDLIARAAHELRTPLTSIVGFAATLHSSHQRMNPADLDESFAILERQTRHLGALLDELLGLGRYRHAVPARTPVDVADVIVDALEVSPPPRRVSVRMPAGPPTSRLLVAADRSTLTRALVNLLTNAYRYGGPNIAIGVADDATSVALSIEDDGSGIPSSLRASVFAPFVQGENNKRAKDKGSGLGLAVSRGIAESFGGDLTYEPVRPHGARFTLTLPTATPLPEVDGHIDERPASTVPLPLGSQCASP